MGTKIYSIHKPRIELLPSPAELHAEFPTHKLQEEWIHRSRHEIFDILNQRNKRFVLIVGPCSIHDPKAAKEYATKLRHLATEVSDTFLLVMRVHYEKPRSALGWKGFLYDPTLDGSNQIAVGLRQTRQLLLDLADLHVPVATEFLDPLAAHYLGDLISWGCIGARTAASQTHRQLASSLQLPIAFKNATDGNIDVAVNGILAAQAAQSFLGTDEQGRPASIHTQGNPHGHLVLRGGENKPNYDPQSIYEALEKLTHSGLPRRLIVDCSHDNSARKVELQPYVFQSVIRQYHEGNAAIRGLMLESNLFAGQQPMPSVNSPLQYAVSLTDPCLDWETTEWLIRWGHKLLNNQLEDGSLDKPQPDTSPVYAQL